MGSPKFKVGDKVRVLKNSLGSVLQVGSIHEVVRVGQLMVWLDDVYWENNYFFSEVELVKDTEDSNPWSTQVDGTHYTDMKIQPFEYSMANDLDPMQHTAIKYISRFRKKNGIVDLEKAIQTLELLIHYEKEKLKNDAR